ncbi:uncharacterized protein Eint_091525 [Encephalitozoon intestinalis ATCC 50506]|uniref:Uncharacterized protein n=1 Tax=Encephalitozoon intestinalis (strain ATCC 50506) TaxID=876142 RepID=W8P9D6_ENCIT|nr:uncharacterized protein Eint_091525 [Encephalitozoon intestinalis ATCC 50506]AHL30152.1 hypothetical protein Eint_091525 [Encephalitozoon intestinalis ATCC 50506]UTX46089.1 hypothetical protein GPK93_09g16760 [Encephalitozoon intestinalis]
MSLSLHERKERILKRLEFTLENTHSIICDINTRLEKIVDNSKVLERVVDAYEIWSRKNSF